MPEWLIERLSEAHERGNFDCGVEALNEWLQKRSGQWAKKDLSQTYVVVEKGKSHVLGYYALASHCVAHALLPNDQQKGLPKIDIPVALLGRLAVDRSTQGQGLGKLLVIDALRRAEFLARHLGIRAVEVTAINEAARQFYLRMGFLPLIDDQSHLFLPMHVIHQLTLPPLHLT
jgi:GNAT superfamily N-acetyltransferase